jgi:hypothetical protein
VVTGTASETACAQAAAKTRRLEHVVHVYVMIYRVHAGRCRFVRKDGTLGGKRSCKRPIELRARGTVKWGLRLKVALPAGHYSIRSDAVDGLRHHQRRSGASFMTVTVH